MKIYFQWDKTSTEAMLISPVGIIPVGCSMFNRAEKKCWPHFTQPVYWGKNQSIYVSMFVSCWQAFHSLAFCFFLVTRFTVVSSVTAQACPFSVVDF